MSTTSSFPLGHSFDIISRHLAELSRVGRTESWLFELFFLDRTLNFRRVRQLFMLELHHLCLQLLTSSLKMVLILVRVVAGYLHQVSVFENILQEFSVF